MFTAFLAPRPAQSNTRGAWLATGALREESDHVLHELLNGAAALHGKAMEEEGYTVDQVVHHYGDICPDAPECWKYRVCGNCVIGTRCSG